MKKLNLTKNNVRHPVYAGSFYPASKKDLTTTLQQLLSENKSNKFKGKLRALIVPHAGYIYSGPIAAFSYNALLSTLPKKIILFGPTHHIYLQDAYSFAEDWETPIKCTKVTSADLPIIKNDKEHCLEVQLPFLQFVLKEFKFTPILYGEMDAKELADIINNEMDEDSVLIASSDLSHYLNYDVAKKVDNKTIEAILKLDYDNFLKIGDACGKIGIAALIVLAKKYNWKPILLDYRNSKDTASDKNNVVGYTSIAFVE